MSVLKAAVVSWKIRHVQSDGEFFGHYHDLTSKAHDLGAEVVVFPENQTYEILSIAEDLEERNIPKFLHQYAEQIEEWTLRIARSSGMIIVGGSHLKLADDGPRNVCPIAFPDGNLTLVEKNRITTYESQVLKIGRGKGLPKPSSNGLAAAICYDIEFPEAARSLAEAGALAIAVPSFTEDQWGFQRVRWCSQARAIENQIFVLHAALIGSLGREPVPSAYGSSAILAPSMAPFPSSSILAETACGEEEVVAADLDFDLLQSVRDQGDVRNWKDREPYHWDII